MQIMYESVRLVSAHLGVFEQIDDPVVLGFADAMQYGQRIPTIPEMDAVWNEMPNAIQRVREGQQDPKTALDQALTAIQATARCSSGIRIRGSIYARLRQC